jgi:4-hydroxy-tetrahydrodipicolinate synthase
MLPETVARLAKIPNIVGVKEASGSLKQMSDIVRLCGERFSVLSGDDFFTLPLMAIGGKGVISVASNVAPADMAALVDAAASGDMAQARSLHHKLTPLIDALFVETNPVPVKAALKLMGRIDDEVRLPLSRLSDANLDKLRGVMKAYGLIS